MSHTTKVSKITADRNQRILLDLVAQPGNGAFINAIVHLLDSQLPEQIYVRIAKVLACSSPIPS
jgi:hypothetical protein